MLRKYGPDVVNDLEAREKESKKWTREELLDVKSDYTQKLKDLHNGIAPVRGNEPLSMSELWGDLPLASSVQ